MLNFRDFIQVCVITTNHHLKSKRKKKTTLIPQNLCKYERLVLRLIESMMELRPRQGNLRLVFRLFSLMRGLPNIRFI